MKKLLFAVLTAALIAALPMTASAEVNGGMNTYASASGYDVGIYSAEMNAWAPGFVLDNSQYAVVGAWNGMAGVSQYADYTSGYGFTIVNTGTDASVNAGWWGLAGANADNSTVFQVPGVVGFTNNAVDLSASFGGQADASSNSMLFFIGEED